jgi:beta-lactamase superfamily II metal-dependent hydrolase
MAELRYLDDDVVRVYEHGKPKRQEHLLATLFWGDSVRVTGREGKVHTLDFTRREFDREARKYRWVRRVGAIPATARFRDGPLLKVRFVDVGQGDATIIESPGGQVVLLDGGEEAHLANYVSAAWAHVLRGRQLRVGAVVVTHGDADHFAGLPRLMEAKRSATQPAIVVDRVYHNGLVKATESRVSEARLFGATARAEGATWVTDLVNDLDDVPEERLNATFRAWRESVRALRARNPALVVRRLEYGDDDAFDVLAGEGIGVEVLGPITELVEGAPALRFLRTPGGRALSAGHTVNGHSVVLRLTFGNVRFLFGADLNEESEEMLVERARADSLSLAAEVLKVPHHGSADFSPRILEAIRPVVSVVSSGDESTAKEYIHPRAGLIGALGKYSRASVERPLIYVTEMVAFFQRLGRISAHRYSPSDRYRELPEGTEYNNAYAKIAFGIVHVRTDGRRVLVATHSGKAKDKESYAFTVDERGDVAFDEAVRVV